jgi:hypothetical protein
VNAEHFNCIELLNRMNEHFGKQKDRRDAVDVAQRIFVIFAGLLTEESRRQGEEMFRQLAERASYSTALALIKLVNCDRNIVAMQRRYAGIQQVPVVRFE